MIILILKFYLIADIRYKNGFPFCIHHLGLVIVPKAQVFFKLSQVNDFEGKFVGGFLLVDFVA